MLTPRLTRAQFERFIEKVEIPADPEGCWLWRGMTIKGYGMFGIGTKVYAAHRISYVYFGGYVEDEHIHHICETALCVHPEHLECLSADEHWQVHNPVDSVDAALWTHVGPGEIVSAS